MLDLQVNQVNENTICLFVYIYIYIYLFCKMQTNLTSKSNKTHNDIEEIGIETSLSAKPT